MMSNDAHGGRAIAMTNPMKTDGHHSNSAPQTGHCLAITEFQHYKHTFSGLLS